MDTSSGPADKADAIEAERLAALDSLNILDTPAEEAFDRITRMAAEMFDVPIALISLVDAKRQWFKSKYGLSPPETPREISFCQHTIRHDEVMVVTDATQDPRFVGNPLVNGDPNIRFYAGAPLRLESGLKMGSMCIIDTKARELTEVESRRLAVLAQIVVDEMELRVKNEELEKARAAAESAAQIKSDFMANMSHELRTPLTSIIGFAGLLSATGNLGAQERHFAERINEASKNLLALVSDVLDFAKLEAGHFKIQPEETELAPFLESMVRQFGGQKHAKGLSLELVRDPSVPSHWRIDPHAVRQILMNFLSNALKFTEKGSVRLEAGLEGDALALTVRDTGVGIAPDRLDHIFERFVQADNSISRRFGGTGLGLAISKRLAELMNAALHVTSTPGVGSAFTLTIPKAKRTSAK